MMAQQPKTEIATVPVLQTGGKLQPIIPQSWNEAVQMAAAFVRAGMVPKHFEGSTEKATVAILAGLEVGLTPMSALQSIAVINNMPTIFGDGMLGLVRASGLLEDLEEGVDYDKQGHPVAATCRVKRKGEKTWGTHTFTIDDAMKGGLLGKSGPWKQYPQRMLQMRARAWALRDKFADVLRGLQSREEVEDMIDITPAGSVSGIEPRREDYQDQKPASSGNAPDGDAAAPTAAAGGGGSSPAETAPSPTHHDQETGEVRDNVTDVDEAPEFPAFKTFKEFIEFSDHFLQDPDTSPSKARAWEAHYRDKIAGWGRSENPKVQAAIADVIGLYSAVIGVSREPGEEG